MAPKVKSKTVKGAGGALSASPKKVAVKKESGSKVKEEDQQKLAVLQEARTKAAKSRTVKANAKKADAGAKSLALASVDLDRNYINTWLDDRQFIVPFVANIMRNGLLEKNYIDGIAGSNQVVDVGKRVFAEGATKFKSIKPSVCVDVLAELVGGHAIDWFKGDDKLPLALAVKAVLYLLGVDEGTAIPKGHQQAAFYKPLIWLFWNRVKELGDKLEGVTKETLDARSDWFVLSEDGDKVFCNCKPQVEVQLNGVDMRAFNDWVIVNGHDYANAKLVSDDAGDERSLARPFERHNATPVFNAEFDFPANASIPGLPGPSGAHAKTVSPQQSAVDAVVAKMKGESAPSAPSKLPLPA